MLGRSTIIARAITALVLLSCGIAAGIAAVAFWPQLGAMLNGRDVGEAAANLNSHAATAVSATPAADGHAHANTDDLGSLALSPQGRKNIGLKLATVELQDFTRTVSMPATIVGRPGRSEIAVSAPMTGIVTRIYQMRGEAVLPGASMFDLRLTHEDLVEKQSLLLRSLEELDVVKREVARLDQVTASGAVAGKRLLEREYEQQKIEAVIRAERQALRLHGLAEEQIEQIIEQRQLLQTVTVRAPEITHESPLHDDLDYLQVSDILVKMGDHVETGSELAEVTDHCELMIEGKAFEQDAGALNEAANQKASLTALIKVGGRESTAVSGLQILYLENRVERDSRALNFYVRMPNELVRNEETKEGYRFIGWQYRPGQRVELLVPVQTWKQRIVLPIEAIIQEGPEAYVYLDCQGHFDRKQVHVEYRDQRHAVIESDGTLFPGDKVAANGAYQIHLALKNQAGGGADAHAGHHH